MLRHAAVVIECAFTKRYYNSLPLLMRLSRAERVLLDFITEEMDDDNFITNSAQNRAKFNGLLAKVGQEQYSEGTIHRCFANLTKHNLLTKEKGRGLYQVSPIFFFRGSEEQRAKVLRKHLEQINREPVNAHRRKLIIQKAASSQRKPATD